MLVSTYFIFALICVMRAASAHKSYAFGRIDYEKTVHKVDSNIVHDVVFCVEQRNIQELDRILADVSDPFSPRYGRYLSSAEVAEISANPVGSEALRNYLHVNGIEVIHETLYGEYITARGKIGQWEHILSTKFNVFNHVKTGKNFIRSMEYTLPDQIFPHVSAVFNVIDLPRIRAAGNHVKANGVSASGSLTPAKLVSYYKIDTTLSSSAANQTIYSSLGQYFSSSDIALFQSTYGIPNHPVDSDPQNRNNYTACNSNSDICGESNLDLEYIMAISQKSYTSIM